MEYGEEGANAILLIEAELNDGCLISYFLNGISIDLNPKSKEVIV